MGHTTYRRRAEWFMSHIWMKHIPFMHKPRPTYECVMSAGCESRVRMFARPNQMHIPLLVNRFQKSILLIVQHKFLKSCSGLSFLQNLILRTRSCGTGFISQSSWAFHFHLTTMVRWKCFVPPLYQFRRGISGGPALQFFHIIHRGGRYARHHV